MSLNPLYLAKRPMLFLLFAILALLAGFAQDPKFYRALAATATSWSVSREMLLAAAAGMLLAAFAVIRVTLETRYVTASQAWVASALFLLIFLGASFAGFAVRLFTPEGSPTIPATTPPAWLTLREALVAIIALTFGASGAGAIYNLLFVQKTDYAKFRAEIRNMHSLVAGMRSYDREHSYVPASHGAPLASACKKALDTLEELLKIESKTYVRFVDECVALPLRRVTDNISVPEVQQNPESFLKDPDVAAALTTLESIH